MCTSGVVLELESEIGNARYFELVQTIKPLLTPSSDSYSKHALDDPVAFDKIGA